MNIFQKATKVGELADMASRVGDTFRNQKGREEDLKMAQQNALQMLAAQQAELMRKQNKDTSKLREELLTDPETRRVVESLSRNPQETDALLKNYVDNVVARVEQPGQPLQMGFLTDHELENLVRETGNNDYAVPNRENIMRVIEQKAKEYQDPYTKPSTFAVQDPAQLKEVPLNPVAEPLPLNYEVAELKPEIQVAASNANASTRA